MHVDITLIFLFLSSSLSYAKAPTPIFLMKAQEHTLKFVSFVELGGLGKPF
jgi:hypothetical protein